MKKDQSLIIYNSDKVEKVKNLIEITEKILNNSQTLTLSDNREWWNELSAIWKIVFSETIKGQKEKIYYNFFYDKAKENGIKIEVSDIELNEIIHLKE